jgi:hypothetical protein
MKRPPVIVKRGDDPRTAHCEMTMDQNVLLTSRGQITIRVDHDARFYRGVAALLDSDGTRERPLHFVFLACHADMADEAPIATTERLTKALAEEVLVRSRNQQNDVRGVLEASNAAAAATDRYYSIVAGRVTQSKVSFGAVGSVDAIVARGTARTTLITPNVVRVGEHAVFNGAFGVGFQVEAVSAKQFDIENGATLLLMVGKEGAPTGSTTRHQDAESLIEDVVRAARISPPIVAVVR